MDTEMDIIIPLQMQPLPFATDALVPYISKLTMDTHYNRNYKGYVDKTNELIGSTDRYDGLNLEEIIEATVRDRDDPLFQQVTQVWNHEFYFKGLSPKKTIPGPKTLSLIERSFGDVEKLKLHANEKGMNHFGSGWLWLNSSHLGLTVATTPDSDNFLGTSVTSLATIDLWEHSYWGDRLNDRKAYLDASWNVFNWDHIENNL